MATKRMFYICYPIYGRLVRAIIEGDPDDPRIKAHLKRTEKYQRGGYYHGYDY